MSRRIGKLLLAAATVSGTVALVPLSIASSQAKPEFFPPFECGEQYTASSYSDRFFTGGNPHGPGPVRYGALDYQQPNNDDEGDPVLASATGTVYLFDEFDDNEIGKGYVVLIDHGGDGPNVGWDSYYGHLEDTTRAPEGSTVRRGQQIGIISDSAAEPDDHLHYEQRLNGNAELIEFEGTPVPYWLDNDDGNGGFWAADARSQTEADNGATGPWLTPPSTNCGIEPEPTTSTTTATTATTSTSTTTNTQAPAEPIDSLVDAETLVQIYTARDYSADNAQVLRLYQAVFRREPDVGGAKYWIGLQQDGLDIGAMAQLFTESAEYHNTYGSAQTDEEFLDRVYLNVLGRTPDAAGRSYWLTTMDQGLIRGGVVFWFSEGAEFRRLHPYGG